MSTQGQELKTNMTNRVVGLTPTIKTAEQRKAELKQALANIPTKTARQARVRPDMPTEVKELVELVEGLDLSDIRKMATAQAGMDDRVPSNSVWGGYTSDKTGKPSWSCGEGMFDKGTTVAIKGQYVMAIKVGLSIYEKK